MLVEFFRALRKTSGGNGESYFIFFFSYRSLKRAGAFIRSSFPFLYFLYVHGFLVTLALGPMVFLRAGLVLVFMHAMMSFCVLRRVQAAVLEVRESTAYVTGMQGLKCSSANTN